jgi:phospholipase D1/2
MLESERNCWRQEHAARAALIVDAADYFRLARQAMLQARSQILLIGWDFDTRIFLEAEEKDEMPAELGPFLSWLAKNRPDLKIHILRWNLGAVKLLARGTTVFRLMEWSASRQISFKLDSAHPLGASHHQKIVVIDDRLAFCGGIDMTATRWDTREHRTDDPRRRRPTTHRLYGPWHDATMAVDGNAARALGDLARMRWETAGGEPLPAPHVDSDPWPEGLKPNFNDVRVAIARTRGSYKDVEPVREIEALFVDMIRRARRFVYVENQFFASRVVAEEICKRLAEPDGPEFVVVNPNIVEGWVEEEAMSPARAELMRRMAEIDVHGRFRIYTPVTSEGEDIYVHSKIMIVDDEMLRVGSANLNNRSMGLDSECDLLLDVRADNGGIEDEIGFLRCSLLAEHLGVDGEQVKAVFDRKGLIGTIEALRGEGRSLRPFEPKPLNAVESALARNELLDPESAGNGDDPAPRPGLVGGLRNVLRFRRG